MLNTALPSSERTSSLTAFDPAVTTASWYAALPSDDKKYISSVIKAEQSIMSKGGAAAGAKPTGMVGVVGAGAVAGVVGVVVAML